MRIRFSGWNPRLRLFFLASLLLASTAFADTARIAGNIFTTDSSGTQTPWPNARVTLKKVPTGRELSTVSNGLGQYSFVGILAGDYVLTVSLSGFETVTKQINVTTDAPATVDFQLVPATHAESVTVSANPTGIDTSSSSEAGKFLPPPR
jgi:hypothetical protein